ncbi:MAG: hypothetical protein CMC82_09460 [Flavobacteriaceae bacterium]|nr:hypothetical protein [Flavobacteriaceae bacterium]
MRNAVLLFGIALLASLYSSCRKDFDFRQVQSTELRFSRDTVYLDTVFTNISSATYTLKVYNQSDDPISIPSIYLENGAKSNFRLNVDGRVGKSFDAVELLPNDSMYVFVETTADIQQLTSSNTQFLYEDKIHFSDVGAVTLMTLVQDAVFLYPEKDSQGIKENILIGDTANNIAVEGRYLKDNELIFTNEKPYVVYGYMGVPSGKTVTFEAGARLHFYKNSGIIVANDATMIVDGTASSDTEKREGEVIFEGDRLEALYDYIPGQWGAIWLTAGSTQHKFNHATIKNATVGILMDYNDETNSPTLTLENTQIHNSSAFNLWGKTAYISSVNSVFGNAGQSSFAGTIGGKYDFKHCTFANYWTKGFRTTPAVLLNDYAQLADGSNFIKPLNVATFENCIIEGNKLVEFFVEQEGSDTLNFYLDHTALQFESSNTAIFNNPFFDWDDNNYYNQIIRNGNPAFVIAEDNDMRITQHSDFLAKGAASVGASIPIDLAGNVRTSPPDLGAYQHVIIEN